MTHDEIEVTLKVRMKVFTGGLFEEQGYGMVPTDPKEWAPTSDMGYTMKTADVQVRETLPGMVLGPAEKVSFWGTRTKIAGPVVTEILKVKTLSQAYVSGE